MMDSFKAPEVVRMEKGGNTRWREFWVNHAEGGAGDDSRWVEGEPGIKERYPSMVGEEWKERLAIDAEGGTWDPAWWKTERESRERKIQEKLAANSSRSATPAGMRSANQGRASPAPSFGSAKVGGGGQKAQNEAYFAKMGQENASRPEGVAPNQGGKYAGFGNLPASTVDAQAGTDTPPNLDEFAKDPVGALTKGLGWFTTTVGKGAKSGYDGWIAPAAQKVRRLFNRCIIKPGSIG